MVKLYSRSNGTTIPNELVGLDEPSPYVFALLKHTAKMDAEKAKMEVSKAHEVTFPVDSLYARIKSMSLFPSIYTKPK